MLKSWITPYYPHGSQAIDFAAQKLRPLEEWKNRAKVLAAVALGLACVVGLFLVDLRCRPGDRSSIDGHDLCSEARR